MEFLVYLAQFLCLVLLYLHFDYSAASPPSVYMNFSSPFSSSQQVQCSFHQSHALLQFKASFSISTSASPRGDSYPKTESWKEDTDCCLWDGVSCDLETGNVIGLNLSFSMLYGTFHSHNSLFLLSHLQNLDLSFNNFNNSPIPSQFGHLFNLRHLNLNSSSFAGQVPPQISSLSNLISLDLSWNSNIRLNSDVFNRINQNMSNLRELELSWVDMSMVAPSSFANLSSSLSSLFLSLCNLPEQFLGYVSLPNSLVSLDLSSNENLKLDTARFNKFIQNLTKLRELDLGGVDMSMVAPSSFANLSSSLSSLLLSSCNLPEQFLGYVSFPNYLVSLNLFGNYKLKLDTARFNKIIPNLTKLRELDLSDVNLSMVAPTSFMNFSSSLTSLQLENSGLHSQFFEYAILPRGLVSLDLSLNFDLKLDTGGFVKLVQNLTKLEMLILESVNLPSVAPNSLMNLSSSLTSLRLGSSSLRGELPANIVQRPNLELLDLSYNVDLTGLFAESNWSSSLQYLDASWTNITIILERDFIANLRSLKYLRLDHSNFHGSNLELFGDLLELQSLSLSYNRFNCEIPSSFGNLQQLRSLSLSSNNFTGAIPSSFGNLQQLTFLSLSSNNFTGAIPSSFSNLQQLNDLDLHNNSLTGLLPAYLSNFTQLQYLSLDNNQFYGRIDQFESKSLSEIDLSNNMLQGLIPSSIFTLPDLGYLSLQNNQFYGHIGKFESKSISLIDLSNNKLQGLIPASLFNLPDLRVLILSSNDKLIGELSPSICNLKSLEILDLSDNHLTGFIPQCLGNFSDNLSVLHLGKNSFEGAMPMKFSSENALRYLNFNANRLRGHISSSIVDCKWLEIFDLGNNEINDTFPIFLGSIPNLQILLLHSNNLHGPLNGFLVNNCSFPKLRILDISRNDFVGPLPTELLNELNAMMNLSKDVKYMSEGNYSYDYSISMTMKGLEIELVKVQTALTTLDLSCNKFEGRIPDLIGELKALRLLNLSHNSLTGNIPPSLGNLWSLESLDLSSNLLSGRIPLQLLDLTFLGTFRVSHNQLEGYIPLGKQFNTFGNDSYVGNLKLCGFPLTKVCDEDKAVEDVDQFSHEEDSELGNGFGWYYVMIGYGCGLVLGVSISYIMFTRKRLRWLVEKIESAGHYMSKMIRKKLTR